MSLLLLAPSLITQATVKEENPNATFGEMGKLLGARWKEMDDNAKKPYQDKAEEEKKRYEDAKAAYVGFLHTLSFGGKV
jgi:hypothetical protein